MDAAVASHRRDADEEVRTAGAPACARPDRRIGQWNDVQYNRELLALQRRHASRVEALEAADRIGRRDVQATLQRAGDEVWAARAAAISARPHPAVSSPSSRA